MLKRIGKPIWDQRGITGLETAIILIAFVVVAAVFAYTALSAGIFSAQKGQETIYGGLKQAAGTMQIKGNVIAKDTDVTPDNKVDEIIFVVANAVGGEPIDMTIPSAQSGGVATGTAHKTIISYLDKNQRVNNVYWSKSQLAFGDSDDMLEPGEEFEITVSLAAVDGGSNPLQKDTEFTLEIKPVQGASLVVSRLTPNRIDVVTDLR